MLNTIRNKAQSFGVKLIFGIIIIVFIFWGVGNMNVMSSGALATVNGENITVRDFGKLLNVTVETEKQRQPDITSNPEKFEALKRQVLMEMIYGVLLQQEAKRLGIIVTPHELKASIDKFQVFHDDKGVFDAERYKAVLTANKLTPGEFEDSQRRMLLEGKVMRAVSFSAGISEAEAKEHYRFVLEKRTVEYVLFSNLEYGDKAEVTDEEIGAYYEAHADTFKTPLRGDIEYLVITPESLAKGYPVSDEEVEEYYTANEEAFQRPANFQVRHIYISCPPDDLEVENAEQIIADAKKTIEDVAAKLKTGGDFSELAKEFSQDEESKDTGGMLGWLEPGQSGSKVFDDTAFALEPGQISEPVRTEFGFHIIRLEGKRAAYTVPLVEAKNSIINQLGREKAEADFSAVEKKAEDTLALGGSFADLAGSLKMEAPTSGLLPLNDLEKLLNLHSDSRQALADSLTAAAASGAGSTIPMPLNSAGGIALVRIIKAEPPVLRPLDEVRADIVAALKSAKAPELAKAAAEQALPAFTGTDAPEGFKDKIATSKPLMRVFPTVEPLGLAPSLVEGVFNSSGQWLPRVYETPQGMVIARTASVSPVGDEEWNQFKGIFIPQFRQNLQMEAMEAFTQDLLSRATVAESPGVLESLQPASR